MLKQTIKTTILSALLIQNLTADSSEHTFADGAILHYTLPEGKQELSKSPLEMSDINIDFPYLNEAKIVGKSKLSKEDAAADYKILLSPEIDPSAYLEFDFSTPESTTLRNNEKGTLSIQLNEGGEFIQGSHVIAAQGLTTIKVETLDYSHEYKKADEKNDSYSNTLKLLLKNGETIHNIDTKDPFALQEIINNPFSQFKEIAFSLSYLSSKNIDEDVKNINAALSTKGHKGFTLESTLTSENPFAKVQGAEKLEGFTFTLSIPTIDLRIEGEKEKNQLRDALEYNIKVYEAILEQHPNSFTDKILASLKKNEKELIERNYKYFTEFSKDDIFSFLLQLKGASTNPSESQQGRISSLAELALTARKFNMKVDFEMDQNGAYKSVIFFNEPDTSIKELSHFIRTNAFLVEPILKDLGYLEIVQNSSNPEKMLNLLRQLSDDPKATGNSPLTITATVDEKGVMIGTLSMERAAQLVMGWALMAFPLSFQ